MTQKSKTRKLSARPLVFGTGLIALDTVIGADKSTPIRYWAGGTCGNVLIELAYLGWSAQPVARLANDTSTDLLLRDLRRWRVSARYLRIDKDGSTPIIVHRITRNGPGQAEHSFSWRCTSCGNRYPGYKPELVTIAEVVSPRIKTAQVFFFDRLSAAAIHLAKEASEHGALVVFETSSIGKPRRKY